MSVYVDQARNRLGRMIMCHMVADTIEELHAMAAAIGMKRIWFQERSFAHYDVCQMRRRRALELGAVELTRRELATFMRNARHKMLGTDSYGGLAQLSVASRETPAADDLSDPLGASHRWAQLNIRRVGPASTAGHGGFVGKANSLE